MNNRKPGFIGMALIVALLLTLAGGIACAANGIPMSPELAAKRENVRKQQSQRITPEKRRVATEALKAERLKVYKARQAVKQLHPVNTLK